MNRNTCLATFAASGALLLALSGCTATAGPEEEDPTPSAVSELCPATDTTGTVTISMSAALAVFAPVLMAQHQGEFEKAGIDLVIEPVPAVDALPLLAQGQIDGSLTSYSAFYFNAVKAGLDVQWVMPLDTQQVMEPGAAVPGYWARVDVVGDGPEPDLEALRGQNVGSPTSGTGVGGYILDRALEAQGLDFTDVVMQRLVGADALAALQNGAVAATWIAAPMEIEAAKDPNLRPIAGYAPGVTGTSIVVGPGLLDRPQLLVKFIQVISHTNETYLNGDYRSDPETVATLSELLGTAPDVIENSALLYFDPEMPLDGADEFLAELERFIGESGGLEYDDSIPATDLYDPQFVEAAMTCSRDWMSE